MNRRRAFFIPEIVLDRNSAVSLHRQICQQISQALGQSAAAEGARLPSTRVLARLLGVSRNTVFAAYEELANKGLIRGERGSGMRINAAGSILFGLRHLVRDAHYPDRTLALTDPDGNPLYVNH